MKKSLLTLAVTSLVTITAPTVGMENPLATTKTPTFTFELTLSTPSKEELTRLNSKGLLKRDKEENKHFWDILGITTKDDTKVYITEKALYKNDNGTGCWRRFTPTGFPLSTSPNPSFENGFKFRAHNVTCPTTFPKDWVDQLKKDGSIILKNGKFETPAIITFTLKKIIDNSNSIPTKSNNSKYVVLAGLTTIIAYLIYLQQNNKLDLSYITNFIQKLTNR